MNLEEKKKLTSQEEKLLLSMEKYKADNPYLFFVPCFKAESFVKMVGNQENKKYIFFFIGGNGSSKSAVLANMIANICCKQKNKYFDFGIYKNWPYLKRLRIVSDPTTISEKTVPELFKWLPKGQYKCSKEKKSYFSKFYFPSTDFSFDIMSYDQDPKEFESVDLGACIAEGERVLLSNGVWRNIEDIVIGDEVVSYGLGGTRDWKHNKGINQPRKQQYRKVTAVSNNGIKDVFTIKTTNGFSITTTDDHKLFVSGKGWIEVKDIDIGDKLITKFPECKSEVYLIDDWKYELLGAWLGDGWIDSSPMFACYDGEYLERIKSILPSSLKLRRHQGKKEGLGEFAISLNGLNGRWDKNEFLSLIKDSGLFGKKAYNKFIPDFIFSAPVEKKVLFLSGLFSTDGWVTDKSIGFGTTSEKLAKDLQLLLLGIGIKFGLYYKKSTHKNWKDQWFVISTKSSQSLKFLSIINVIGKNKNNLGCKDIALSRVNSKCGSDNFEVRSYSETIKRVSVRSKEYAGKKNVYDITVDGTHNFICNGILTHNCFLDEPPSEDVFNACLSRLRVGAGGIQCAYFTPLASASYIFDRFIDNPAQKVADWVYISVFDNLEGKETRGFLRRETVERMIETYTPEEREARIDGKFMHLGGLIFREFDRTKHIVDITLPELVANIPHKSWRAVYAIDPHPVENTAVLFMALLPDGRRVFIDEIWQGTDSGVIAKRINENLDYYERLGADTVKRIGLIDPSAVIKDKLRGDRSWKEDLANVGIKTIEATKDRDRADDTIRQELRGTINPNIYFLRNSVTRTIWEFARYQKDPNNPAKRLDKNDHMVENAGRLLIAYPHQLFYKTREHKRREIIGLN